MSSLHTLPIEALEWVTSTISVRSLLKLYACGNRTLNTKLGNGGVKTINFQWKSSRWALWPSYLFDLFRGVEVFSMGGSHTSVICPTMALETLPRSLKNLRLAVEDSFLHVQRVGAQLPILFPQLEELDLIGVRLSLDMFHNLPPTLTHLSVADFGHDFPSSDFFALLPPTLRILYLWFNFVDQNPSQALPPNLEKLHISSVRASFDFFEKLPSTLETLAISAQPHEDTALHPGFDWKKLPRGLTELHVDYPMELTSAALIHLPTGLKSLESWMDDCVKDADIANLPRSLTSFQSLRGTLTHEALVQCPPNLDWLTVDVSASSPDIFSLFPQKCTNARLVEGPFMKELRGPMLPLLTSLELAWITDEYCAMMPRESMYYLEFTDGDLSAKGAAQIPKSITNMYIAFDALTGDDVFEVLNWPKRVTLKSPVDNSVTNSIFKRQPLRVTHECLKRVKISDDNKKAWKYVSISIYSATNTQKLVTDEFLSSLNGLPNIKTLTLEVKKKRIEPEKLAMVPRTVTDLTISPLTRVPIASDLDLLPPNLVKLDMKWSKKLVCKWEDELFAHLPRNLHQLRTSAKSKLLTKKGLETHAPPYLFDYRARWAQVHTFQDPICKFYGPDPYSPTPEEDDFSNEDFWTSRDIAGSQYQYTASSPHHSDGEVNYFDQPEDDPLPYTEDDNGLF